ncbi:SMP-30/gluconolactonase/LRE family protein [Subtercola sp. YIM 133946]|uniref:SMP-30/gluconolactonase/LRE family protein n=1 Tax=Subtercola sp. YIM 133946 TaxID=3118909 RepID=UPI002F92F349
MIITDDILFPEGPLLLPDGTWLVTEMTRGIVTRVFADGSKQEVASTGSPNGLAQTRDGIVWIAESINPSLMRLDLSTGDVTTVLSEVEGLPVLWPNDLCVGPDGAIYVTDSGLLRSEFTGPGWPEFVDGRVFRYDPATGESWFVDRGIRVTNGIAFGPDGRLYVNETATGNVYRYSLSDGRKVGDREYFGNVLDPQFAEPHGGPDGMAFSSDGRLWVVVFGYGDIAVLDTSGTVIERFVIDGDFPTNLAFGEPGRLYVVETQNNDLRSYEVDAAAFPLHT